MSSLSRRDQIIINRHSCMDPVQSYLREAKNLEFNVGDYLIKKHKAYSDDEYQYTIEMQRDGVTPVLYQCIFKTEQNVCYLKQVLMSKKESKRIICVTDSVSFGCKWEVYQEYIDSLLLGHEFVPYDKKSEIKKIEKATRTKFPNRVIKLNENHKWTDVQHIANNVKIGPSIYSAMSSDSIYSLQYNDCETNIPLAHKLSPISLSGTHKYSYLHNGLYIIDANISITDIQT